MHNLKVKKLETQDMKAFVLGFFLKHQRHSSFYFNLPELLMRPWLIYRTALPINLLCLTKV